METPDFDPTVILAAMVAGPVMVLFAYFFWKSISFETEHGFPPYWQGRLFFAFSAGLILQAILMLNYWFFWNFACIIIGVSLTGYGTYQAILWLTAPRVGQKKRPPQG